MREIIKMIVVLTAICSVAALLLAGVSEGTKETRKLQVLTYVKGPAVKALLSGATNDPVKDAKEITLPGATEPIDVFPAFEDGALQAIAFEAKGKGFGGDIGVVLGIDLQAGEMAGIGIASHKETPGLGARCEEVLRGEKTPWFLQQFKGKDAVDLSLKNIQAITGATITSRAIIEGIKEYVQLFLKEVD